jgi:hypothetical protein
MTCWPKRTTALGTQWEASCNRDVTSQRESQENIQSSHTPAVDGFESPS